MSEQVSRAILMFVLWSLALVVCNYLLFFSSPPTTRAFLSSGDDGGEWHCFYPYQKQVLLLKTRVLGVFRIHGVSSFQCWLLLRKQLSGCAFGRQSWWELSASLQGSLLEGLSLGAVCALWYWACLWNIIPVSKLFPNPFLFSRLFPSRW